MGINFVLRGYLNEEKLFSSTEVCKECKGRDCCQNYACTFSPEDFHVLKNTYTDKERFQYFKAFFKRGYAVIDERRLIDRFFGPFENIQAVEKKRHTLKYTY